MRRLVIALSLLLLAAGVLHAQETRNTIRLKNGSKITGKIVESRQGISLKIETQENSIRTIAWSEIDTILPGSSIKSWKSTRRRNLRLQDVKDKGFAGEFGAGYSRIHFNMLTISLSMGYQFNPWFALMVGTGVEGGGGQLVAPIYAEAHVNLLPRMVTPFAFIRAGNAFVRDLEIYNYSYQYDGSRGWGVYLNVGGGLKFMLRRHFGFSLKGGYRLQGTQHSGNLSGGNVSFNLEF